MRLYPFTIYLIAAVLTLSCSEKEKPKKVFFDPLLVIDSLSLTTDPISVVTPKQINLTTNFELMLAKVEDSLGVWGYKTKVENLLKTHADFNSHWLLKLYFNRQLMAKTKSNRPRVFIPTASDWQHLVGISQVSYLKGSGHIVEEWKLTNEVAAIKWTRIINDAGKIGGFNPTLTFWAEANKIYMVITKGSTDERHHQSDLVKLMSGHNTKFIKMMTQPLDLPTFKKLAKGANSGSANQFLIYLKPDTTGHYYRYFNFQSLNLAYRKIQGLTFTGLVLYTYINGEKIGWYNKVDEDFISVKAKVEYGGLGVLNIVGKNKKELAIEFGEPQHTYKEFDVYYHNKTFLLLHYENGKVAWFRYIRTNITLHEIDQIPMNLLRYDEHFKPRKP
jgi:hypothetical protein